MPAACCSRCANLPAARSSGEVRNAHCAGTKGAVVSIGRAMAVGLGCDRFHGNSIFPVRIRSAMTARAQPGVKFNRAAISRMPMTMAEPQGFCAAS